MPCLCWVVVENGGKAGLVDVVVALAANQEAHCIFAQSTLGLTCQIQANATTNFTEFRNSVVEQVVFKRPEESFGSKHLKVLLVINRQPQLTYLLWRELEH